MSQNKSFLQLFTRSTLFDKKNGDGEIFNLKWLCYKISRYKLKIFILSKQILEKERFLGLLTAHYLVHKLPKYPK